LQKALVIFVMYICLHLPGRPPWTDFRETLH